jgi:hypothetical protein
MKVKGQNPVVRYNNIGELYVGYDFDKDKKLDLVDYHFLLGDHTIPYFSYTCSKDSPEFEFLQEKYGEVK